MSFANCGLPYHIGEVIKDRSRLLLQTPESLDESLAIDVRTAVEATAIEPGKPNGRNAFPANPYGPGYVLTHTPVGMMLTTEVRVVAAGSCPSSPE
jgi:hypothetical protein